MWGYHESLSPMCRSHPGLFITCQPQTNAQALEMDLSICNPGAKLSTSTTLTGLTGKDSAHPLAQSTRAVNVTFAPDEIALMAVGPPLPHRTCPRPGRRMEGDRRAAPHPERALPGTGALQSHLVSLSWLWRPEPPGTNSPVPALRCCPAAPQPLPQPVNERSHWLKPPGD